MKTSEIDYHFTNGLQLEERTFKGGSFQGSETTVSRQELLAVPNKGSDPERDARVAEQMSHPFTVRVGGTAVNFCVIGPESSEAIMPSLYGWGGNTQHPVAINEAQVLAANLPDTQLVFCGHSTGASSTSNRKRYHARKLSVTW